MQLFILHPQGRAKDAKKQVSYRPNPEQSPRTCDVTLLPRRPSVGGMSIIGDGVKHERTTETLKVVTNRKLGFFITFYHGAIPSNLKRENNARELKGRCVCVWN